MVHNLTLDTFSCEIQSAINDAAHGNVIEAAPRTYHEIIDFSGMAITLRSTDPTNPAVVAATIIDGTGVADPGDGRPVVRCDSEERASTVLDGFTITGGTGHDNGLSGLTLGGGIHNRAGSSPTVTNCTFSENSASRGGGIYNRDGSSSRVTNCTFSENSASDLGGGMYNDVSSPRVTNCTFSGNSSVGGGGGMYNKANSPTVTNCTFWRNSAIDGSYGGGGIFNNVNSSPSVANCILWGNSARGVIDSQAQISGSSAAAVNYSDVQGGWIGGAGNIDADPLFVDADGIVGTVDDDLRLSTGSPCIDSAASFGYGAGPPVDLDGNERAVDDPSTPNTGGGLLSYLDMGAYEFPIVGGGADGDLDNDGDVDLDDFALFMLLFAGPF